MEFAVWVFKHGASEQLEKAAPDILQGLWTQLEGGTVDCSIGDLSATAMQKGTPFGQF